jgi:protein-S-isoprenylcysteine O-methyltransferase Ste14
MQLPVLPLSPWVIPAAALVYGFFHSVTASLGFKRWLTGVLGERWMRYYRLVYSIMGFVTLLPVLALAALVPDRTLYVIPAPWRYLAFFGQAVSVLLLGYSVLQTGALQFIGVPQALGMNATDELNTGGLYRYVRHPLYTFSILFLWLTPVMTRNLALLYTAFTIYFIIGAVFEERKLLRTFGDAYAEYRKRTPFIIPFIV